MEKKKGSQKENGLEYELNLQKKNLLLQKKAFLKIISELKKQDEQDQNSSIQEKT